MIEFSGRHMNGNDMSTFGDAEEWGLGRGVATQAGAGLTTRPPLQEAWVPCGVGQSGTPHQSPVKSFLPPHRGLEQPAATGRPGTVRMRQGGLVEEPQRNGASGGFHGGSAAKGTTFSTSARNVGSVCTFHLLRVRNCLQVLR